MEALLKFNPMLNEMVDSNEFDETEFSIQLGHVCAHLNRAWNTRNLDRQITEEEWEAYSKFRTDLKPVG